MIKGTLSRKFRKEKDMTKHILTKHILMALAMAAMVPAGQAWAADPEYTISNDNRELTIRTDSTVGPDSTFGNRKLNDFDKVTICYWPTGDDGGNRAMGIYSAKYDLESTDVVVNVKNNGHNNNDGVHLTNWAPHFVVKSYRANINSQNSDALNISHDAKGTENGEQPYATIGDLTAIVSNGNGIRANSSINNSKDTSTITVTGKTDITINSNPITVYKQEHKEFNSGIISVEVDANASTTYNPAAVYAGDDMYSLQIGSYGMGGQSVGKGIIDLQGDTTLRLNGEGNYGVYAGKNGSIDVNNISITSGGKNSYGIAAKNSNLIYGNGIELTDITATTYLFGRPVTTPLPNMSLDNADDSANRHGSTVTLHGDTNVITMTGDNSYALYAEGVDAGGNSNTIKSGEDGIGSFAITGDIAAENGGNITLNAIKANSFKNNSGSLTGTILASGQNEENSSTVKLHMKDTFSMTGDAAAKDGGIIELTSGKGSGLTGSLTADGTGSSVAFSTDQIFDMTGDASATTGGKVALNAGTYGGLTGDLTADGNDSSASLKGDTFDMTGNASATAGGHVTLTSERYGSLSGALTASGESSLASMTSKGENHVDSETIIPGAGGLGTDAPKINSALYAEHGGQIDLGGSFNYIAADYSGEGSENYSRRAVWAYDAADINITGGVQIAADDSAQDDPAGKNSTNMAIVAGTSTNVTSGNVNNEISDRATVTVNYDSESAIKGDIVSAYAGQVDIRKNDDNAKINITGNLLAGNNGILNVNLGNGGVLEGRADDYGDAGSGESSGHGTTFFNPVFSSDIYKGGAVNLTMGEGSRWNVTGQSWITRIDTTEAGSAEDSGRAVIDLVSANTDRNETAHALTISEMKGDAVFHMSLDGERDVSDMLYMKNASGDYIINVVDPVTTDDMYAGNFHGLRFATVGTGSDVSFRAVTIGQGLMNVEYTVKTDPYEGNEKNEDYNGTSGDTEKPGDAMVDGFFDQTGKSGGAGSEAGSSAGQYIMLMTQNTRENSNTETQENEQPGSVIETTNYKLTGIDTARVSNAGQTVLALSRVNYSNAVYMDRLNKRMGEARYIDGDDGLWVRLRHDRIGKEDAFRTMNTMFELGYDRKVQDQKNGEHRRGVAFDYMRGEADYTNVMGSGDVRRAGVWLYDTWLGDKGHYSDYVVKYGRLSNDFDIFNELGTKVSGDYDNDVWSASAEYGRKKDIGNEWYFEPQAQLQYAYVTSADYTTSQNTKVSLDGIDSLIGRAGFRLGRDTSEGNTVYFKADILHEFLGDQRVYASDITGALDTTYDNEGTWYDVGFGFSHRMGEDSYMFLDVEHSFGNDNEDTYQINIGLNRAF